jgi:hypothetical protein
VGRYVGRVNARRTRPSYAKSTTTATLPLFVSSSMHPAPGLTTLSPAQATRRSCVLLCTGKCGLNGAVASPSAYAYREAAFL